MNRFVTYLGDPDPSDLGLEPCPPRPAGAAEIFLNQRDVDVPGPDEGPDVLPEVRDGRDEGCEIRVWSAVSEAVTILSRRRTSRSPFQSSSISRSWANEFALLARRSCR
jgi:hypothetical protein